MAVYILWVCPMTPAHPSKRVELFLVAVAIVFSLVGTGMQVWMRGQLGDEVFGVIYTRIFWLNSLDATRLSAHHQHITGKDFAPGVGGWERSCSFMGTASAFPLAER
jgi:hypothetical protein